LQFLCSNFDPFEFQENMIAVSKLSKSVAYLSLLTLIARRSMAQSTVAAFWYDLLFRNQQMQNSLFRIHPGGICSSFSFLIIM
jgi:hypothetical protein